MTTPLIEAIAHRLWMSSTIAGKWADLPDIDREPYRADARAAITALTEAGYAIVPVDAFHALDASHVALDDWLHTYAPDECLDEHVQTTRARIFEAGGTLAYIADLQQENRRVLKGIWEILAPLNTKEGE